ncbi:MAG: molybdopterin-dependent oxidoreductase [Candidatus Nanopelagicales bacterium]
MNLPGRGGPPPLPMFAADAFPSRARSEWLTARLGTLLGAAIAVCFATGLVSHLHQNPVSWLPLPAGPVWGYRVSQGLHVATGLAALPLLVAKLWSVYPRLFVWPPVRSWRHALERGSVALLAAATGFELLTGVLNVAHLYLWPFFFPAAHYAVAWVVAGSVLVHLAVKWPAIVRGLRHHDRRAPVDDARAEDRSPEDGATEAPSAPGGTVGRRAVLWAAVGGAAAITATTVGQTLRPLGWAGLLAPRSPEQAPQGMPVNRTAAAAGVVAAGADPGYRLVVAGPRLAEYSLADLQRLPQTQVDLPIACVEGWSATGRWSGIRLRDLLDRSGVPESATVRTVSLERDGLYASAEVPPQFARHPDTLLALRLDGRELTPDHGFPVRLIAPNRPGVLQTKWVGRVEVVA